MNTRIIRDILLGSLALLSASCASQREPEAQAEMCDIVVTLHAGELHQGVRSTWGDPYQPWDGLDEEKAISHLALYLACDHGQTVALVPRFAGASASGYSYKVSIPLNASYVERDDNGVARLSGRLVAVANHPGAVTMADPFSELKFSIHDAEDGGAIPMWGVATLTNTPLVPSSSVHVADLRLLRALARISIRLDEEAAALFEILSVKADSAVFPDFGHITPAGASDIASTLDLDMEDCFHPVALQPTETSRIPFNLTGGEAFAYAAETVLTPAADGLPQSFTLTLQRRDRSEAPFSGKVYLCDYPDRQPDFSSAFTALVRNHDYRYNISLSPLGFKVDCDRWIWGGKIHLELE